MNNEIIKHKINTQGAPLINTAFVFKKHSNVLLINLDMRSKYCEILATGENESVPEIMIDSHKKSLYLHKKKKGMTSISFPTLKGWDIFCCETSKYTVRICFHKKSKNANPKATQR